MLSRRNLLKALGSALLAAAGGASLWRISRGRKGSEVAAPPDPPTPSTPLLSFWLLSDIHMNADNADLAEKLQMAMQDIAHFQLRPDTIVLGGDLVDGGREADYQRLSAIMSPYKLPKLYGLMGNHEYYHIHYNPAGDWSTATTPNGKTDAQARERFMRFMGYPERTYHDTWVNGVHLIMLSQETYVEERPAVGEGAWYSDAQLAWLEETMRPHADGKPAFVFIHQPLPPAGSDGGTHRLMRAKEFRAILEPYRNVLVFSGHTHRNLETEGRYVKDTTFHWFSNASVGKTRAGGSVPNPVQGLYVQVFPDQVVVRGREFSNRTWISVAEWAVKLT